MIKRTEPGQREVVLRHRAEKLAKRTSHELETGISTSVVVLRIGNETFGLPTEALACISRAPKIARLPQSQPWLRGVSHIRGSVFSVIDLAIWLGIRSGGGRRFLAVIEQKERKLGILVDEVVDFRDIAEKDIAERFWGETGASTPIRAVTRDLVAVLDIEKLFADRDMRFADALSRSPPPEEE